MTEQEVLEKMKESEASVERGPGHIKVTYTYPLKLTAANPGGYNQVDCYRETTDALQVGVHTNNMKYAKDNFAATGQKVTKCPNGFDYPTNKDEQGYFWIKKSDGSYYVRAKFENIAPEYKQKSRYFIDGQEVTYQDLVDAYNRGEFEKSALAQATDKDLFDRHVAVDRITDIKVIAKESLGEGYFSKEDVLPQIAQNLKMAEKDEEALQGMLEIIDKLAESDEFSFDKAGTYTDENRKSGVTPMNLEKALLNSRGSLQHFITQCENYMPDGEDMFRHILGFRPVADLKAESVNEDYGWEIPTDKAWEFFDRMERELGTEELLLNLAKALGDEKLAEYLAYIARQFDLSDMFEEAESGEVDMDFDDDYTGM